MPLFFIISGFLYGFKEIPKISSGEITSLNFFRHKVIALGIPYIIFSCVYIVLNSILQRYVNVNTVVSLGNLRTILWKPIAHYWFLWALLFLFGVVSAVCTNRQQMFEFLIVIILSVVVNCFGDVSFAGIIGKCVEVLQYFAAGTVFGIYFEDVIGIIKNQYKKYTIVALIIFSLLFYWGEKERVIFELPICKSVMAYLGSIAFAGIVVKCNRYMYFKKGMIFIGDNSWYIYLLHSYFVAFTRMIMRRILGSDGCYLLELMAGTIVPVAGCLIISAICKKTKVLNYLFYPQQVIKNV